MQEHTAMDRLEQVNRAIARGLKAQHPAADPGCQAKRVKKQA
jgi:hypothetical protein